MTAFYIYTCEIIGLTNIVAIRGLLLSVNTFLLRGFIYLQNSFHFT